MWAFRVYTDSVLRSNDIETATSSSFFVISSFSWQRQQWRCVRLCLCHLNRFDGYQPKREYIFCCFILGSSQAKQSSKPLLCINWSFCSFFGWNVRAPSDTDDGQMVEQNTSSMVIRTENIHSAQLNRLIYICERAERACVHVCTYWRRFFVRFPSTPRPNRIESTDR